MFLSPDKLGRANGERYPLAGGTRPRHFGGTSFESRKLLENAATPASRVHAVLGGPLSASVNLFTSFIVIKGSVLRLALLLLVGLQVVLGMELLWDGTKLQWVECQEYSYDSLCGLVPIAMMKRENRQ